MALFHEGDAVEVVCINEEGFYNSYWEGTIVRKLDLTNNYVVRYKNLVKNENSSHPLREVVPEHAIRPVPPTSDPVVSYNQGDRVDTFDRDGWWAGTVLGLGEKSGTYRVHFEAFTTDADADYDVSKIRIHQDWVEGEWSVPN